MLPSVLQIRDILVRIRASEEWIRLRILLFSSLTFKTPTKNYLFFFHVFLLITVLFNSVVEPEPEPEP
jgi:hypothetical protein